MVHLHLGIFLSDEDMVDAHIDHYDSPREYERALLVYAAEKRPDKPVTTLSQSERSNGESEESLSYRTDGEDLEDELDHRRDGEILPFPHGPGDCPICAVLVSASQVRARELEASLAIARKLRSVKTISWSSFFPSKPCTTAHASAGDGKTTTTYVLRANGRVRVRRRPWD